MIRPSTDFNHTATFSKLSVTTAFTIARHVIFLVEGKVGGESDIYIFFVNSFIISASQK